MRRKLLYLTLFLAIGSVLTAQERDSLLSRINAVKMAPERYLYGLCTLQGCSDPSMSLQEAHSDLADKVNEYLTTAGFKYLRHLKDLPAEKVKSISCEVYPSCFRSIAYIEKRSLTEAELSISEDLGRKEVQESIAGLLAALSEAKTIEEVGKKLSSKSLEKAIEYGDTVGNEILELIPECYLVYYDGASGKVIEIMTPSDESGERLNLSTGSPADPMSYTTTPIWIHIKRL
ncbi:MAG: hypothetical protein J6N54_10325 [Bacteroidales bacterium]|nr:hypothetical protein [Bacteroidales bacterium]